MSAIDAEALLLAALVADEAAVVVPAAPGVAVDVELLHAASSVGPPTATPPIVRERTRKARRSMGRFGRERDMGLRILEMVAGRASRLGET
jgi:hypothetical protein